MRKFIDLITETLQEAPISDFTHVGDFEKSSSFRKSVDRKLVTNPKALTKIKTMWKYPTEVDYNIILVNNAEANLFTEVGDVGKKPDDAKQWLENNMPKSAEEISVTLRDDQVNIIFTNNKATQHAPMTGWVMAHRFGHALFARGGSYYMHEAATTFHRYIAELATQYGIRIPNRNTKYDAIMATETRALLQAIGTFKSARDNKLRNSMEILFECFAQYIMIGEVRFNPIPRSIRVGRSNFIYRGGDDYEHDCRYIQDDLTYELKEYYETAVHYAVGHTFVM